MWRANKLGKFIVDGVEHDLLPESFKPVRDMYGVRSQSYATLDGRRTVVNLQPEALATRPGAERRLVKYQAFTAVWTPRSFMDLELADHLVTLETLNKVFWLQYDDEMSRDGALLIPAADNDYSSPSTTKYYFTPTYPIVPYGYLPSNGYTFEGTIWLNGLNLDPTKYSIDADTGLIRIFNISLNAQSVIQMAYTWKACVRIAELDIRPIAPLAQVAYVGNVTFAQVFPDYSKEKENQTFVELTPSGVSLGSTNRIATQPTVAWGDTRYASGVTNG